MKMGPRAIPRVPPIPNTLIAVALFSPAAKLVSRAPSGWKAATPSPLRAAAMNQAGYVSGETLVSTKDNSNLVVISTWSSLDEWEAWETSETRAELYKLTSTYLQDEPTVRTFQIMATE